MRRQTPNAVRGPVRPTPLGGRCRPRLRPRGRSGGGGVASTAAEGLGLTLAAAAAPFVVLVLVVMVVVMGQRVSLRRIQHSGFDQLPPPIYRCPSAWGIRLVDPVILLGATRSDRGPPLLLHHVPYAPSLRPRRTVRSPCAPRGQAPTAVPIEEAVELRDALAAQRSRVRPLYFF